MDNPGTTNADKTSASSQMKCKIKQKKVMGRFLKTSHSGDVVVLQRSVTSGIN